MLVKEEHLEEHLSSLSPADWKQLTDLIPAIEKAESFGQWVAEKHSFPYVIPSEEVDAFKKVARNLGLIVVFDWGGWKKGFDAWKEESYDYKRMSLPELCKMLTVLVRGDRFSEGTLVKAFEKGVMLRILEAFQAKVPYHDQ